MIAPPATKIVSQNALAASDCYVIPVIPDDLSSRGVTHFRNLVQQKIDGKLEYLKTSAQVPDNDIPQNFVEKTRLAGIVPFLAKYAGRAVSGLTNIHTEQIAALRRTWKNDTIQAVGRSMIGVTEAVNAGWPVWNWRANNVTAQVKAMMSDERLLKDYSALLRFLRSRRSKVPEPPIRSGLVGQPTSRVSPLSEEELRNVSLEHIAKLVSDEATSRRDLEQIAIHRFSVPRGSMRSFSNKRMLADKLLTLITNERTHLTITAIAQDQAKHIRS